MFSNSFANGFLTIFYSIGSNPLNLWDKAVKNGHIRRIIDDEVKSLVLEIAGTNVATTYITCPLKPRASLGIRLPYLVMVVKNLKKYFTFEIQILDDKNLRRRFRVSNFQSTTKVRPFCTTMPIGLSGGWNQIQFNLADFTRRAYGTIYVETVRVQVHANVRIRRIYFSDRLYSEEELPSEYKLFLPMKSQKEKPKEPEKEKRPSIKGPQEAAVVEEVEQEIPGGAMPSPVTVVREESMHKAEAETEDEVGTSLAAASGDVPFVSEVSVKDGLLGEEDVEPLHLDEGEASDGEELGEGEEPVANFEGAEDVGEVPVEEVPVSSPEPDAAAAENAA